MKFPLAASPHAPEALAESLRPAAVVNGIAITAGELEEELGKLLISPATHAGMNPEKKDETRKAALEELIVRQLAYQRARAMGLKVNKSELAAAIKRIKDRYKTEKDFQEALKVEEITEQDFKQRIERDLLLKKIYQVEIEDKAKTGEETAKKYYEENRARFLLPESVHLKNIVVRIKSGKEDEAKKKIDEVYEKLKSGSSFYEMAYKFSEDDYRVLGGDYDLVHRGQLDAELEASAFDAKPDEITVPFKTRYGWHVIKVENRQTERQLSYEEVKEKIKNNLYQKRRSERRLEFINSLKATASIEYAGKGL
ncbi:MAG: peptidylprolyl isomerase [Acidobacteria bacterium]|nr:peptidylprolyl isomerase [Acidobacteriota bacterium]